MDIKTGRRSDIDVLRAIAVLLVIGYHYFPNYVEIGYLGVDIFLVISGYLMVASYNNSNNAKHFITKRAYRLVPALLAVALICFILITLILRKDLLYDFSKEIITSITGVSNHYYYSKLGYFDPGAENKLFLMSWTLSLEFQYYVLLALSFGIWLHRTVILPRVSVLSLGSSYFMTESAVFYLIVSRLWEFLVGALLYLYLSEGKNNKSQVIILSTIVLIIAYVIHLLIIESHFVIQRIMAVILSIFVISKIVSFDSIFNRLYKVLLWIGESSYSLYLIHWPVLFFATAFNLENSVIGLAVSLTIVFILGRLNFIYVEKKLTKVLNNNNLLVALFAIVLVPVTAFALNERSELIEQATTKRSATLCNIEEASNNKLDEVFQYCSRFGIGEGKKIVLWGDSHINRIARPIINSIEDGESLYLISHNGCPPLVDISYINRKSKLGPCNDKKFGNKVVEYINKLDPDMVILASRWPFYFNGYGEDLDQSYLIESSLGENKIDSIDLNNSVGGTIKKIEAEKIIVLLPPLELKKQINLSPNYIIAGSYFRKLTEEYNLSRQMLKQKYIENNRVLFFDIEKELCKFSECKFSDVSMHYYQDTNHLSDYGADYIYTFLKDILK